MRQTNQVFLQLREANRFATSKNPLQRRWAVILLDNLVELLLGRKVDREMLWDETTWYGCVRKYSSDFRYKISRFHNKLINFAKGQGWITQHDCHLLEFVHDVRNGFYHRGLYDKLDCELAIRLLYRFIGTYFPLWKAQSLAILIPTDDPIPIASADDDSTAQRPLLLGCETNGHRGMTASGTIQSEDYWKKALRRILTYRPRENIRRLIKRRVSRTLKDMQRWLAYIEENKDLDFTLILNRRFYVFTPAFEQLAAKFKRVSVTGALNFYLAVIQHEEKLLDIEDPQERATEFHKIVDAHVFNPKPVSRQQIANCRRRAQRILKRNVGEAVGEFLAIEKQLGQQRTAIYELCMDVEGHIQMLIDERLGK